MLFFILRIRFDSIQSFDRVDSLWPRLWLVELPCLSAQLPEVYWASCPIESVMWSTFHPLSSFSSPSIFPRRIRVFPAVRIFASGWPSDGFWLQRISHCGNIQGPIAFAIDWLNLLAVSVLESSPAPRFEHPSLRLLSFLRSPALSHPCVTAGKTMILTGEMDLLLWSNAYNVTVPRVGHRFSSEISL